MLKYYQITQEIDNSVLSMEKYISDQNEEKNLNQLQKVLNQTHFSKIKKILQGLNKLEQNCEVSIE